MLTPCSSRVVSFETTGTDTEVGMYVWHRPRGKININKQTTNTDKQTRPLYNAVYRYIIRSPTLFVKENILKTEQVSVSIYCKGFRSHTHSHTVFQ